MKKLILLVVLTLSFYGNFGLSQTITKTFFGQNAWMPDSIGSAVYKGKLHSNWDKVKDSGAGLIRFGGIGVDENKPTNYQYIKMVDAIRNRGMEPMLQVPFANKKYTPQQAAEIVKYVNITQKKNVKYWVIGNEPDLGYKYTNSSQVAAYLKSFSAAMKDVDPSIIIVGPEVAWFNTNILYGLTTPGGPDDVTGKDSKGRYIVDIISFHCYPFNGTQSRADVLSRLTSANDFEADLTDLNARVAKCNNYHNRTGSAAVRVAVTECNIDYANPASDGINGTGANSFVGGQFWAEMLGIAMKKGVAFVNFWSTIEGNNTVSNIGYIDNSTGNKKPTFHHFKMMADNFSGQFTESTTSNPEVKIFSAKSDNYTTVMILNQSQSANLNYTVKLSKESIASKNPLKINVDANINKEYNDYIQNQSTTILVFNSAGLILRKTEYKIADANANKAPVVTVLNQDIISANTEISSDDEPFQMKVFPNPTKGPFNVKMNIANAPQGNVKFELINSIGQIVISRKANIEKNHVVEMVEYSGQFAVGFYIVRILINDQPFTSKVILV